MGIVHIWRPEGWGRKWTSILSWAGDHSIWFGIKDHTGVCNITWLFRKAINRKWVSQNETCRLDSHLINWLNILPPEMISQLLSIHALLLLPFIFSAQMHFSSIVLLRSNQSSYLYSGPDHSWSRLFLLYHLKKPTPRASNLTCLLT